MLICDRNGNTIKSTPMWSMCIVFNSLANYLCKRGNNYIFLLH